MEISSFFRMTTPFPAFFQAAGKSLNSYATHLLEAGQAVLEKGRPLVGRASWKIALPIALLIAAIAAVVLYSRTKKPEPKPEDEKPVLPGETSLRKLAKRKHDDSDGSSASPTKKPSVASKPATPNPFQFNPQSTVGEISEAQKFIKDNIDPFLPKDDGLHLRTAIMGDVFSDESPATDSPTTGSFPIPPSTPTKPGFELNLTNTPTEKPLDHNGWITRLKTKAPGTPNRNRPSRNHLTLRQKELDKVSTEES